MASRILLFICTLYTVGCSAFHTPVTKSDFAAQAGRLDTSPRVAVATAYAPEFKALRPEVTNPERYSLNGVEFWTGEIESQPVVLFMTGVSVVNAAMNTQLLLDHFNIQAIVVSGVAGGVDPTLSIGDVTVPIKWAQYDEAIYTRDPESDYSRYLSPTHAFDSFDFMMPRGVRISSEKAPSPKRQFWFPVNDELMALATNIAQTVSLKRCDDEGLCLNEEPEIILGGVGVTGSIFLDNADYRDYLFETFNAQSAEMETAAIAMVAHANDVPYIAFRSLSDLAGGGHADKNEIEAFQGLAAENSAALLVSFLKAYKSGAN